MNGAGFVPKRASQSQRPPLLFSKHVEAALQTNGVAALRRCADQPVFGPLGFSNDDDLPLKIDILGAQAHSLHQPHARAIQQPSQQRGNAIHLRQ